MTHFYFDLESKEDCIPDDSGKELATLNDACDEHARKLINKIFFTSATKMRKHEVVILNDEHDA